MGEKTPASTDDDHSPDTTVLEERLEYPFENEALLAQALTHRSHVNEHSEASLDHNERLEFLGDAVIDLSVGHCLMEALPAAREGQLSKLRAMIVNEVSLAAAATRLQLGRYLRLGRGEEQTGGRLKSSILADAFEALMGAIYLDGGFATCDGIVRQQLRPLVDRAVSGDLDRDHKTRLQELAQATVQLVPRYEVVSDTGPDHAKTFEVAVCLGERELARATGGSKKEAEQQAAHRALELLKEQP